MGQIAAMAEGASGISGAGGVGLLTAGEPPAGNPLDAGGAPAAVGDVEAFDPLDPSGLVVPSGAEVLTTARRSPCGTGWPDDPARGTHDPVRSGRSGRRGEEQQALANERTCGLAGHLGSVHEARDFARTTVCGWGLAGLCDDVTAVVSELVTNALRYGLAGRGPGAAANGNGSAAAADGNGSAAAAGRNGSADAGSAEAGVASYLAQIELRLKLRPADVVCMVADPGTGVPALTEPGYYAEGGRGLHVVESCSDRWGWDPLAGGGKVVWAAFHL